MACRRRRRASSSLTTRPDFRGSGNNGPINTATASSRVERCWPAVRVATINERIAPGRRGRRVLARTCARPSAPPAADSAARTVTPTCARCRLSATRPRSRTDPPSSCGWKQSPSRTSSGSCHPIPRRPFATSSTGCRGGNATARSHTPSSVQRPRGAPGCGTGSTSTTSPPSSTTSRVPSSTIVHHRRGPDAVDRRVLPLAGSTVRP